MQPGPKITIFSRKRWNPISLRLRAANRMRNSHEMAVTRLLTLFCVLLASSHASFAASHTQSITLQPGWNAVWLEVEPVYTSGDELGQPRSPQDVFTNA